MNNHVLDTTHFTKAIRRLVEGYDRYLLDVSDTQIRDGLIQRFEFTYEISHKLIKRNLELTSPSPDIFDVMPFADLIRSANEKNWLKGNWSTWKVFREMRGKSSHTYDENIAVAVVKIIPEFILEAKALLHQLNLQRA
jgi:nucleotidyltransferase substrate binding protein (TIGR01987 family)